MAFQYAVLRAVPRVERGERINIGIVLYCQRADYLDARVDVDVDRLTALCPDVDATAVQGAGDAIVAACRTQTGTARENTGLATRFGILTAPRSTVVQPGPVHAGMTDDPPATLELLMDRLVRTGGAVTPR